MKKVLITRRLLSSNEERLSKLWNVKLNMNDEIYSQEKLKMGRQFLPTVMPVLWQQEGMARL